MKLPLSIIILVAVACIVQAQDFDPGRIQKHIKALADDKLEGRGTGTEGEKKAAAYIESQFKKLKLQPKGDNKGYLQSFTFKAGAHGEGAEGTANNIAAYLDNGAATTIIIGAHYDHLGLGEQSGSLEANSKGMIHNGADDNASGVAGVIELASYFTKNKVKEKNNFLFLCFSGEELGLFGSKYIADHLPVDLSTINYMVNMDMVGRLDPQTKTVVVHGTGTSPVWETLVKGFESDNIKIKTDSSGVGPSDHTSFYLKDLPVLHFFTGSHSDYHKPSDDWQKINYAGETEVLKLIAKIIESPQTQGKLVFLKTKSKQQASRSAFKVTMGVMPSYSSTAVGLQVDGVTEGKPAQKAGIKAGDILIQLGEYEIKDVYTYMDALGKFEKGQTVQAKVKRGEEILTVSITF
jgi:Peptidase family M28/PDZ domain